jgi:hypothetical protein
MSPTARRPDGPQAAAGLRNAVDDCGRHTAAGTRPGVFHFDSNARDGHSFAQIVGALKRTFGRTLWQVRETDDCVHDKCLVGDHLQPRPLACRLSSLADPAP